MNKQNLKNKKREWLSRYMPAEIIGTITSLIGAWSVYSTSHSYVSAAAAGWVGEGIGFYGYFVITELLLSNRKYDKQPLIKRISLSIGSASTNLLVEFLPAELLDNLLIRPLAMYEAPHYIHPYPIGFLVGKFSADIIFYIFAITGYEIKKHWHNT